MKKKYSKPTTEVMEFKMSQMIAASVGLNSTDPVDPVNADSRELEELLSM